MANNIGIIFDGSTYKNHIWHKNGFVSCYLIAIDGFLAYKNYIFCFFNYVVSFSF
ncbi:hypothetical protein SH1V18_27040 [Vallitalea longa]|uniref:Uncharacterized protein n=1 Tax=Vallitalea longa TaxID=2936439 RepID=A0A9W5YBT3_9FIRM|nr:hypothetical protein SH1V18_27040 [Vallitalea longa]